MLGKNDTMGEGKPVALCVLVVDDHQASAEGLRDYLREWGHEARAAGGVAEALAVLDDWRPDAVVCDLLMPPGPGGLELLREVRARDPWIGFIMLTGHGSIEDAVRATRDGAYDFLTKPVDLDRLRVLLTRLAERNEMRSEVARLRQKLATLGEAVALVSRSPAMRRLADMMEQVGPSAASVLITGESGSGKELVAHALHKHSPRGESGTNGPFVAINTAAIPKDLLESELFGHERGAFTGAQTMRRGRFEQADGGTLFLDEIGDMPFDLQTRLLRVLSDGQFYRVGGHQPQKSNVRVIAATHQNLEQRVKDGAFREDLFHRLNVIRLRLPALRERPDDIPMLARQFLQKSAKDLGVDAKRLSDAALARLVGFGYPGNVRQLENICHWLTVMAPAQVVEVKDLPPELLEAASAASTPLVPPAGPAASAATATVAPVAAVAMAPVGGDWLNDLEREARALLDAGTPEVWEALTRQFEARLIVTALDATRGRRIEAAQRLGIGRNTITRKIQELGLDD